MPKLTNTLQLLPKKKKKRGDGYLKRDLKTHFKRVFRDDSPVIGFAVVTLNKNGKYSLATGGTASMLVTLGALEDLKYNLLKDLNSD